MAILAGNVGLLVNALDRLSGKFLIEAGPVKLKYLDLISRKLRTPQANGELAQAYLELVYGAMEQDLFDIAQSGVRKASTAARKARDASLVQETAALNKSIPPLKKEFSAAQTAELKLSLDPDDPDANLVLGWYLCFNKDNWTLGLSLLAKGSDAGLRDIAGLEKAVVDTPDAQASIGDFWWEASSSIRGDRRERYRSRALHWYELALPGLKGLNQLKTEKRVTEISESLAKSGNNKTLDLIRLVDVSRHVISGRWP